MQRNHLGRSVAATLVLLLAGCSSSGDEQSAASTARVTTIVTAENSESDDGWLSDSIDWFSDDAPAVGTNVVPPPATLPPPDPAAFAAIETVPDPLPDSAGLGAIDTTTTTDPLTAAQEPTLGEADTALLPDAPPPEVMDVAVPAPTIPDALQTDDPSVLAVRYSTDLTPDVLQLLTPDGTVLEPIAVGEVTHWTEEDEGRTKFRFGVSGGSASGLKPKFAIGFPLFGEEVVDQGPPAQTQANFKLPDVEDYQKNWQQYRVVMLFKPGTAEEERLEMLPPHPDAMLP